MAEEEVEPEEDFLLEDREVVAQEQLIFGIINDILHRVFSRAEQAELQAAVPAYTVHRLVNDALEVVDMAFVPREDHSIESYGTAGNNWLIDEEPAPPPIDRWARGAVPVRRRPKLPPDAPEAYRGVRRASYMSGGGTRSRSVSSVQSSHPAQSKIGRTANMQRATLGKRTDDNIRKHLTAEEAEREQRLRDEIESRRQAEELQRVQAEKDEEELRRLEVLQKELRGKDYGYDHKGNVIVLSKVDPEKLPAYSVGPRVSLLPTEEELEQMEVEAAKEGNGKTRSSTEKKKKKKDKKPAELEYVQQNVEGQPSMMETMKMSSGVTLREGNSIKPGPRVAPVEDRISRRDFMSKIGSQGEQMGGVLLKTDTPVSSTVASHRMSTGAGDSMNLAASAVTGADSELDWTLDATPIIPPPEAPPATPPDVSEYLVSAPDWGLNPPPKEPYQPPSQPPKVSDRQRELTLGKVSRLPRDRPFVASSGAKKLGVSPNLDPAVPTTRNPATILQPLEAGG